ncbi:MAG TPA: DUF1538 family protein, partial [Sphaerochaeta sp.]|nr:DUF1538 family protein [Sphaerochaeta sp.]
FLAIAVDSSGATTGALTTPFALAITLGLSTLIGGKESEEHAFGLVGVMSAGPILAILAVSLFGGYTSLSAASTQAASMEGILAPLLAVAPLCFKDSLLALAPIATLFFLYNAFRFKVPKSELRSIIAGLFLTLFGLVFFLTGVHAGFLEMGRIIGMQVAEHSPALLIIVGFFIGMIVVLMEPAVHVLGQQIETVTAGHIPVKLIRATLSGAVALAIALSMVRIIVPSVHLAYFLIPGFLIAVILSFFSEPIFVAIAYDAGGVASGPMTATFVLAFAQGAALMIPTADVMSDGFGVIAMVAMAPVLSLNLLGVLFRYRRLKAERLPAETKSTALPIAAQLCMAATVNRGSADAVVRLAREHGAAGATILLGRGGSFASTFTLPLSTEAVMPEQEVVVMVLPYATAQAVQRALEEAPELRAQISSLPATAMVKVYPAQPSAE